jgi:hypothetical protein
MTYRLAASVFGLFIVAAASATHAGCVPTIVIPGKSGIPVVINNYDARWATVEGDCGLSRPGHGDTTVIGGRYVGPLHGSMRRNGYYPKNGEKPEQGRHEIEPSSDRQLPPPAEDFNRSWSSSSNSGPVPPADLPNPNGAPMGGDGAPLTPPIIVVPQVGPRRQH